MNSGRRALALFAAVWLATSLVFAPALVLAQQWRLGWSSIDGGGELVTHGADWELSGTIGQWDADVAAPHTGGGWSLTGGFWSPATESSPALFRDGFED